jgi:hypothetical protein
MSEFPTDKALTSVGLTRQDFLARYVDSQRTRVCEPIERFHVRILTRFYIDFPELLAEPPRTRADEAAHFPQAEYFNGVTNRGTP